MKTTVQPIHPLATRIKRILALLLLAAWLAPTVGLGPTPARAAESGATPVELAQVTPGVAISSFKKSLALTESVKQELTEHEKLRNKG